MACSILIRVLEDKNVKSISNSLLSMYDDRLVPASDIFYIAEHLYAKKYLIFTFINDSPINISKLTILKSQVMPHNTSIDSLLAKYQKTYLVKQEKKYLEDFKKRLYEYKAMEDRLLQTPEGSLQLQVNQFKNVGQVALDHAIRELSELEKLQTQVGRELMADAQFVVSGTRFFSTLQIILSIVIGIMVVVLVLESKSVINQKNNQPFNLN